LNTTHSLPCCESEITERYVGLTLRKVTLIGEIWTINENDEDAAAGRLRCKANIRQHIYYLSMILFCLYMPAQ